MTFDRLTAFIQEALTRLGLPASDAATVPGERSRETRTKRARDGIPIAPALQRGLDEVADELGMAKLG